MREFVIYRGEKFWIQTSGRYFQSGRKDAPERLFHRRMWINNFGPIPDGWDVHHKDGDWRNTIPENLELSENIEHSRYHMLSRNSTLDGMQKTLSALEKARQKAPEWHKSSVGRIWHQDNARNLWASRSKISKVCVYCGTKFECTFRRARFCSNSCQQKAQYRRRRATIGAKWE